MSQHVAVPCDAVPVNTHNLTLAHHRVSSSSVVEHPTRSRTSSETKGLVAGTMRYFRAKVYFKSWRAPGNLFLPNQFQKWSNSVRWLGRKTFFWRSSSRVTLSPSYTKQFSSSIDLVAWPAQREDCRGEFQKKIFNEAEEITSLNMGARNQYSSINFLGGFIEGIS